MFKLIIFFVSIFAHFQLFPSVPDCKYNYPPKKKTTYLCLQNEQNKMKKCTLGCVSFIYAACLLSRY